MSPKSCHSTGGLAAMYTLGELAQIIDARLVGQPDAVVRRARPIDSADEGDVTFAIEERYRARIPESRATAIIIASPEEFPGRNLLISTKPKLAFARAIQALHARPYEARGASSDLIVGEGTRLGIDLSIHPRVTIGRESSIGDRVTLYPGVVIGDRCRIGDDATL